ncbi:transmembrane protein 100-like [Pelobates fuscus]|uniref:transmembrane protein 100-like n=1 Tax=Pelobates fuscus TaxID=191477 RepID=UPI002FE4D439
MTVCKSNSLSCLQAAKPGPPPPPPPPYNEAAADSTATLNKLALATGGAEKSWHRCVFPFGAVALVIGIAATCITFKFRGPHMDIAKAVSVAALAAGAAMLVAAFLCWRSRRERQKRRREEAEAEEQGGL